MSGRRIFMSLFSFTSSTGSQRFKTNILVHCRVSSRCLGGFGAVLGFFFRVVGNGGRKSKKKTQNGSKTTQTPRRGDNEQITYDLTVLFSLIFVLNSLRLGYLCFIVIL